MLDSLTADTVRIRGAGGDELEAYLARPLGGRPAGGVVVIHHLPGFDRATKEIVRRFAAEGYDALCPNLYTREAPGLQPAEASALVREAGGIPDDRLLGDVAGAAEQLRNLEGATGKVAVIGYCSGGRHSFLAACSLDLDAAIDCYGAFVVNSPPPEVPLDVGPVVHLAPGLSCPLLGLFGAEDLYPAPGEVVELEAALVAAGKEFEFHVFEGAGHAFFNTDRDSFRPEAAREGWAKVFEFLGRHLSG